MRNLIFLLADSQSRAADAITGSPLGCARRRPRACSPRAPPRRRKGCQPTAPDRVPGCGGGRGRPLLPARGRTVAGGVLPHTGGNPGLFQTLVDAALFGRGRAPGARAVNRRLPIVCQAVGEVGADHCCRHVGGRSQGECCSMSGGNGGLFQSLVDAALSPLKAAAAVRAQPARCHEPALF